MKNKKDKIFLKNMGLLCVIGVSPKERLKRRKVVLNITLSVDTGRAAKSDSIKDTVNYAEIHDSIRRHVEGKQYRLLERLVQEVANICLAFSGVREVSVCAEKPNMLRGVESVGVEITRRK